MADMINVAIGAMLGVILADTPLFKSDALHLEDMYSLTLFLILIVMFACNIWITTRSYAQGKYHIFYVSIGIYLFVELFIFLSNTSTQSLLPTGEQGFSIIFTGKAYVWTFILLTCLWLVSNVIGALLDPHREK
jgi:hypothetical protein